VSTSERLLTCQMDLATTYALTRHFVNPQNRSASNLAFMCAGTAHRSRSSVCSFRMVSENFLKQSNVTWLIRRGLDNQINYLHVECEKN
jgi:hypothetical protein